ncbi:MAG: hypothetical protein RI907_2121 [Pseudomonadota bacterium]
MRGATAVTTRWLESTLEMARWENMRRAGRRWGWWGVGLGSLIGGVAFAPAAWLANGINDLTGQRLVLAEAQGTIWSGDAVAVLTGGPGSRDARALPGRLAWRLGAGLNLQGLQLRLSLQQDCCMPVPAVLVIKPGIGQTQVELKVQPLAAAPGGKPGALQGSGEVGHWPAAWLGGLGAPWTGLELSGVLRVQVSDFSVARANGRVRLMGGLVVSFDNVSSRMSTLDTLGSYRVGVTADAQGLAQINLYTTEGALQLSGQGSLGLTGLRFRGEARARSEDERAALQNLLSILGRSMGDRTVISIG